MSDAKFNTTPLVSSSLLS